MSRPEWYVPALGDWCTATSEPFRVDEIGNGGDGMAVAGKTADGRPVMRFIDHNTFQRWTPPLPTEPGSVIRQGKDRLALRVLQMNGRWRATWSGDERAADDPILADYVVIFDAGAKS